MIRWLRSLFAWRTVRSAGVWDYLENEVTGRRGVARAITGGYSPVDWDWLFAGVGMPEINGRPAWRSAEGRFLPDGMIWR